MTASIQLGYEVADLLHGVAGGKRVGIPVNHMVVLGQTQLSGKTTTLEALVQRSGLKAIAFITKPGEKSFRLQNPIPAFFTESTLEEYSKYVVSIIEQKMGVRLGWRERGWIVKLCRNYERAKTKTVKGYQWKQPKTLRDLLANVEIALPHLRGTEEMICMQLQEYLKPAVREIERTQFSENLYLVPGINVMDITELSDGLKTLVIRSVIEFVHKRGRKIVVIVPEAWKFIPEGRSTPVKLALEGLIREGAGVENFVWMDSQDLRGVDKMLLRSVIVWLFGVQRQKNEVANTLASIPDHPKPTATEIMQLGKGQFYVCYGNTLVRTYVQPAGMEEEHAKSIALGEEKPESWTSIVRDLDRRNESDTAEADRAGGESGHAVFDAGSGAEFPANDRTTADQIDHREAYPNDVIKAGYHYLLVQSDGTWICDACKKLFIDRFTAAANPCEESMWKEKYEALKAEFDQLKAAHERLMNRVERPSPPSGDKTVFDMPDLDRQYEAGVGPDTNLEHIYAYVKKRAVSDPEILSILAQKQEIRVKTERPVMTVDAAVDGLFGRACQLTAEGFFKQPQTAKAATAEAVRRGWCHPKSPVMRIQGPLDDLAKKGFLTRETDGYQIVAGVKINLEG